MAKNKRSQSQTQLEIDYDKLTDTIVNADKKRSKVNAYTVIASVLAAIIATSIITAFGNVYKKIDSKQELVKNIQNLYIGCNKEWVDEELGAATFVCDVDMSSKEECLGELMPDNFRLTECVYVLDFAIVHVFYDASMSNRAFFITTLSNKKSDQILFPGGYNSVLNEKAIGAVSYYDIDGKPSLVGGFFGNGNVRVGYFEDYYYMSAGNYYEFIFATLDYGYLPSLNSFASNIIFSKDTERLKLDDEMSTGVNVSEWFPEIIENRKNNFPNTFGMSSYTPDITQHLIFYGNFDSLQLRNKNNGFPFPEME